MVFLLNTENVIDYLIQRGVCNSKAHPLQQIESKTSKNFNLFVSTHTSSLLIKQEPHNQTGRTKGDLIHEGQLHERLHRSPELSPIRIFIPELVHCDRAHSILAFTYLQDYCDLDQFYSESQTFPPIIAAYLGRVLATIHRTTFDRPDLQALFVEDNAEAAQIPDFTRGLNSITPEIFGQVSAEGLKFYQLYQRFKSLNTAIAALNQTYQPCCLTHNDLKFNNLLLHQNWQSAASALAVAQSDLMQAEHEPWMRLIDWEKWSWGDPAYDLGTVVASYLKIWLKSLLINAEIDVATALRLAGTPLEQLHPSIAAFIQSYLHHFPEILGRFPDLLERVVQFAGLALIESLQARLHYFEPFGNAGICMLQVAKTLLCKPEQSVKTVFGMTAVQVLERSTYQNWCQIQAAIEPPNEQANPVHRIKSSFTSKPSIQSHLSTAQERANIGAAKPEHCSDLFSKTAQNSSPYGAILWDIVQNLEFGSDQRVRHRRYRSLDLSETISDRLYQLVEQLPEQIQHNYRRRQLRDYLYDLYFSGELAADSAEAAPQLLENNALRGLNLEFYQQLHQANQGTGYFDQGWLVLQKQTRCRWLVQKEELTLQIKPAQHLLAATRSPQPGDLVAIHLPDHQIESGFYVAVSNLGFVPDHLPAIEICFNITVEGAIALMREVTQALNAVPLPFSLKALLDPDHYQRYDTCILQLAACDYKRVYLFLQQLYANMRLYLRSTTPLFTKPLAPGIGLAEEPETAPHEFGLNRCHLIAHALLEAEASGKYGLIERLAMLQHHFALHQIDLHQPYLNPGSTDLYLPLDATT
ncbi:MAG: hypothetical protein Kow00121_41820 [Elainellaceae cyanobacterium]